MRKGRVGSRKLDMTEFNQNEIDKVFDGSDKILIFKDNNETIIIPQNDFHVPNSNYIKPIEKLVIFPKELPKDHLSCTPFLREFVSCHSPFGFIRGLYRYGENKCDIEGRNLQLCYQLTLSLSRTARESKIKEIQNELYEKESQFYKDHVWSKRRSENEKNMIDNSIFGYTSNLLNLIKDPLNVNKITEI